MAGRVLKLNALHVNADRNRIQDARTAAAEVHLELPDTMTVDEVDRLTRRVQAKIFRETGVILTGVGVYSFNSSDSEAAKMRETVRETVMAHEWAKELHGFYADTVNKTLRFDVVISFDIDRAEALRVLTEEVEALYPDYSLMIVPDIDA